MSRVYSRVMAASLVLVAQGALAQVATDSVQQALELTAIRHLRSGVPHGLTAQGLGIEPRIYSGVMVPQGADEKRTSSVPGSHSPEHLLEIARMIPGAGVVDDTVGCQKDEPDRCRVEGFAGIVSFSVATIRRDTAQMSVLQWAPNRSTTLVDGPLGLNFKAWHFTLVRAEKGWRVVSVVVSMT